MGWSQAIVHLWSAAFLLLPFKPNGHESVDDGYDYDFRHDDLHNIDSSKSSHHAILLAMKFLMLTL